MVMTSTTWVFFQHQQATLHFSTDTDRVSNLTEFWLCQPGDSTSFHRLRAQSHKTDTTSAANAGSPVLLTN